MKKRENNDLGDQNRSCKQCGHPFRPHLVIAYDTSDFSKGGEIRCPVEGCTCFSTLNFNLKEE